MKRDEEKVRANPARNIDDDGVNLSSRLYPELARAVSELARRHTRRRKKRGESVPGGEQRGHSHYLGRLFCWLLTVPEDDLERFQREGAALMEGLDALGADYEGGLPASFAQRAGTILLPGDRPRGGGGAGPPKQPRRHHSRGLTPQVHPRKDVGMGDDMSSDNGHAPGGRSRLR